MRRYTDDDRKHINEVMTLIDTGKEGSYWDFKREYHKCDDKGSILHDILCLANNLDNRTAFLIFGVDDVDGIVGVETTPCRESDLNDWFSTLSFAGGFRPNLHLIEFESIDNKPLGVLVIEPDRYVPYYLDKPYPKPKPKPKSEPKNMNNKNLKTVESGRIFTRTSDKNTSIREHATYSQIDTLYRIRYGLNEDIFTRLTVLLEHREDWVHAGGNISNIYHHKYQPEFTLRIVKTAEYVDHNNRELEPYYRFAQTGHAAQGVEYEFYYNTVLIHHEKGYLLDNALYVTIPKQGCLVKGCNGIDDKWSYCYYLNDDSFSFLFGKVLLHLSELDMLSRDYSYRTKHYNALPCFMSESEREDFTLWFLMYFKDDVKNIESKYENILIRKLVLSRLIVRKTFEFRDLIKEGKIIIQ